MRDKRVDHIGFIKLLSKEGDKLIEKVKAAHKKGARLAGDFFTAFISGGGDKRFIPVKAWRKLYQQKKIKEADFLAGLSVKIAVAEKVLSGDDFEKIVESTPGGNNLNVDAIEGAPASLMEAIKRMGEATEDELERTVIEVAAGKKGAAA